MKEKKLISLTKLKKELDNLWSRRIRERDGKCVLCGEKKTQLYAHHYIINRARSVKYRYDLRNGITLCYACHRFKVHNSAAYGYISAIVEYALDNKIVTKDDLIEIRTSKLEGKSNRSFLEAVRICLSN